MIRKILFTLALGLSTNAACLRPIGFPWLEETTGGTSSGTSATTGESTETTRSSDTSTDGDASTTTGEPGTGTGTTMVETTAPGPFCGDGEIDLVTEECDDGNQIEDDGCTSACGRDRVIFLTSVIFRGDKLLGLDGADAYCRNLAFDAGLPEPLGFRAWLSDSQTDARDRIKAGKGRYVRMDGELIAESWPKLLLGQLVNPIEVTETDEVVEVGVWTGTNPDGTRAAGTSHCVDWTTTNAQDPSIWGFWGVSSQKDANWTYVETEGLNPTPCSSELALYCVEE